MRWATFGPRTPTMAATIRRCLCDRQSPGLRGENLLRVEIEMYRLSNQSITVAQNRPDHRRTALDLAIHRHSCFKARIHLRSWRHVLLTPGFNSSADWAARTPGTPYAEFPFHDGPASTSVNSSLSGLGRPGRPIAPPGPTGHTLAVKNTVQMRSARRPGLRGQKWLPASARMPAQLFSLPRVAR